MRTRLPPLLLLLLAGGALPLAAQHPAPEVEIVHDSALAAAALARLPAGGETLTGTILGSRGSYGYMIVRRTADGAPELHASVDDVFVIRSGRGRLRSGGRLEGGHEIARGEIREGTIIGGVDRPIGAGDLVVIPAGIPHQLLVEPGEPFVHLIIKPSAPPR